MNTEKVTFPGRHGHELSGLLDLPDSEPVAIALFAHCFTCGKSLSAIRSISQSLTAEGIGLLRFDFTGLGQSEGEFAETTFTTNLNDLESAADFLAGKYQPPRILIGHSLGGAAALAVAGSINSVRSVATIGAPAEPVHVRHLLSSADFDDNDTAEVSIGGRPFRIGKQFMDHNLADDIASMRTPLMIFHSPVDSIVGIDNAEKIYKAARHPKSFVSLGDADHLVSDAADARFLGHVLSAWAGYYAGRE